MNTLWIAVAIGFVSAGGAMAREMSLNGGTWRAIDPPATLTTLSGQAPPLLPEAQAAWEQKRQPPADSRSAASQCLPPGLPRLLYSPGTFEFLQRPKQVFILYEWNRLVRAVEMNVAEPEVIGPSYLGTSAGGWDGKTLTVTTTGFNDVTVLDSAGLPHSEQLRVTEEYTLTAENRLDALITIEDPLIYAAPWQTRLSFVRDPAGEIREDVCLERVTGGKE